MYLLECFNCTDNSIVNNILILQHTLYLYVQNYNVDSYNSQHIILFVHTSFSTYCYWTQKHVLIKSQLNALILPMYRTNRRVKILFEIFSLNQWAGSLFIKYIFFIIYFLRMVLISITCSIMKLCKIIVATKLATLHAVFQ